MSENNVIKDMKVNEELLDEVTGGTGAASVGVRDIGPYWVRTTARSGLKCRLAPNGKVLKTYEYGHKLKINGITTDGKWYRLLCYHPEGGTCYGFIYKEYTERI